MTCRCNFHSPFHWRDFPRASIFMQDSAFYKGAITSQTMSQIASASVERYTERTGRNPGSIFGISAHADRLTEAAIHERQKRQRAAGHYGSKA